MKDNFVAAVHLQQFGQTLRYHAEVMLKPQDVAQHSFNVAWFCWLLTEGKPSANLLISALGHDAGERKTGDMPSPTKRQLGLYDRLDEMERVSVLRAGFSLPALTSDEAYILKMSDLLDGCFHCLREAMLGNRLVSDPLRGGAAQNFMFYLNDLLKDRGGVITATQIGRQLYQQLEREFDDLRK